MVGFGDEGETAEHRSVQEEVARLEAERLRRTQGTGETTSDRLGEQRPRSSGDAGRMDATAPVTTAAGHETMRQEMMGDLWADEEDDEFKDADDGREDDDARAVQEPEVKTEPVPHPDEQQEVDAGRTDEAVTVTDQN
ncbi:hypothetical protein ON010_g11163 [Phytophthora cinnamomi]|nr:hypothetical protein ON010_g11163 [Phytophthora cinnamomi]